MIDRAWEINLPDEGIVKKLAKALDVSKNIANLLVSRGIKTFEDARLYFRPQLSHLNDPFMMKNMSHAVKRLEIAISKNQKILVYGDYDVDGTTSVAMMYAFLKTYTKNIDYYIPCRYEEGYGISFKGIDYAYEKKYSLIIALDCGINAVDKVDYANRLGVDFIICDHHNPSDKIPNAIAVLNPKQHDCRYPYKDLSGCGVGFKLIQAYCLFCDISFNKIIEYLDLLVVSIAADIVPLTGENRVLAFYGLKQINFRPRVGLKALIDASQKTEELVMSDLVFGIAPRINAAGRIDHAKKAVNILVESDYDKAKLFAIEIEENNKTRKDLDKIITNDALKMIKKNKKSTVVFSKKWHKGVVGIVASRLIESYYRPTIVLTEKNGVLTGSARSVHDFDLYKAISKCSHLCEKFGGHKYAAGLSIKKENLNAFINKFESVVSESLNEDQLRPKIHVDMQIDIDEIDNKFYRILKQFAPFGPSNLSPVFISKAVVDNGFGKKIGADKSHLRINIKKQNGSISAVGFGMGHFFDKIKDYNRFDVCYSIGENEWRGKKNLQLVLVDIK